MSFLDRLREKRNRDKEQREREHQIHETRKQEIREAEDKERFKAYKAGRLKGVRKHAYKKGMESTRTLSEKFAGTGGALHRVAGSFNNEMNELGGMFGTPSRTQTQGRGKKKKKGSSKSTLAWIME